ncbi:MAG: RNA polymerase sigma factor [Armatimonadetes bacterium]|nr:RNA polymerase sigma factor [Armatimonadota bacterium]
MKAPPAWDEDSPAITRFLRGDQAAFDTLYRKYYGRVFSVARGILLDSDEAADIVQEVFSLAYKNLIKFDHASKFSTWLYRIAVNRSIQEARKRKRSTVSLDAVQAERLISPDQETTIGDPEIDSALVQLHPSDRMMLILHYWEELSLAEIATLMKCNPNAAKTRLYRARARLKDILEQARADEK